MSAMNAHRSVAFSSDRKASIVDLRTDARYSTEDVEITESMDGATYCEFLSAWYFLHADDTASMLTYPIPTMSVPNNGTM
jgi:hypothetical protein